MADNVANILTKPLKGLNTSRLAQLIGLQKLSRGEVEDVSASTNGIHEFSRDTEEPIPCISDKHNEAHMGCHNNSSGVLREATTQEYYRR